MGRTFLFIILSLAFATAMCGQGPDAPATPQRIDFSSADSGSDSDGDSSPDPSSGNGNEVVLERSDDGHFYADVQINGTSLNMLVDTGASVVALSREDARSAGIATSISMPNVVGEGASGDVHGETVTIDRISMGSAEAEDIRAIVLDAGGMSLLGQDFLRQFDSVEIKDDRMILR